MLHSEPVWGNGTTEYALDALLAASKDQPYACPVDPDVTLPMVVVDDLMRGLIALQEADEELLDVSRRDELDHVQVDLGGQPREALGEG